MCRYCNTASDVTTSPETCNLPRYMIIVVMLLWEVTQIPNTYHCMILATERLLLFLVSWDDTIEHSFSFKPQSFNVVKIIFCVQYHFKSKLFCLKKVRAYVHLPLNNYWYRFIIKNITEANETKGFPSIRQNQCLISDTYKKWVILHWFPKL